MALACDGHLDGNLFSSNTARMSVCTLHYRSDPQGRSWWRFLYSKYRLLFNFKCWLFFQGWDTCEIEINKWITHFLWNYYIWLQFFFNITTTVILTKILSILVSLALLPGLKCVCFFNLEIKKEYIASYNIIFLNRHASKQRGVNLLFQKVSED